ncbi:MAG: SpaA isopeptide-forming pilin-related protein [Clostridium sp.]
MNNGIYDKPKYKDSLGEIKVNVFLDNIDGEVMKGIKINLYRINGISPQLEDSKRTDINGQVIFNNLSQGSYRIIEIINKEVYKKPIYKVWNEVNISIYNKKATVNIINVKK